MFRPLTMMLVAILVITPTAWRSTASADAPVLITAIIGLSGRYAVLGEPERNAMLLAEREVNAGGGINGRRLRIDILDDEGKADTAAQLATQAIGNGTVAIISSNSNAASSAVARLTTAAKIPQIFMTPAGDLWNTPRGVARYIFESTPRNEVELPALLDFAQNTLHMNRAAVIYDENTYGTTGAKFMADSAAARKFEILASESYPGAATDFTPQLVKIRGTNPDTIFIIGAAAAPPLITRQIRQLGIKANIIGTDAIVSPNYLTVAAHDGNGVFADTNLNLTFPNAVQRRFLYAYRSMFKTGASNFSAFAYDAVMLLTNALRHTHSSTSGDAIVQAFETMQPLVLTGGTFQFTSSDHNGLHASDVHIALDHNQVWENVKN